MDPRRLLDLALARLDAGDPIGAWALCGGCAPEIRALPRTVERAVLIGRLGIVAAAVGDPFTAVVCRDECRALAAVWPDPEPGCDLHTVLQRLTAVCCTLDHRPTLP